MKIGIFDSGLGGVNILNSIINSNSPLIGDIFYVADTINVPYGNKDIEELELIVGNIISFLENKGCELIISACNTSSSTVLNKLKQKTKIPIIGTIEPTINFVKETFHHKNLIILATKVTIESKIFENALSACDYNVYPVACPKLVDAIEFMNPSLEIEDLLNRYLQIDINASEPIGILLGCTHYPLIKSQIKEVASKRFSNEIIILDPCERISSEALNLISKDSLINKSKRVYIYDTFDIELIKKKIDYYFKFDKASVYFEKISNTKPLDELKINHP
ncbi:glutamate racemase [Thermodesulfobium narugense DSM 14796]|uniref:Glutamate racemase n=1 Tax=Thermodesulfobium narugense DSM 14796 TaxID=747365 RepID=M1E879_9BACT|nr:glutamate racemase [Thermodesulfobium narugense]AEE14795.1 glutamate racemase [Thermodesulfobium narugense DSM 14796]